MERRRVLREYLLEVLLGVERCRVSRDVVTGVGISVAVRLYRTVLGVRGGGVPSCSCVYGPPFPHPSSLGIRARDCELTT